MTVSAVYGVFKFALGHMRIRLPDFFVFTYFCNMPTPYTTMTKRTAAHTKAYIYMRLDNNIMSTSKHNMIIGKAYVIDK